MKPRYQVSGVGVGDCRGVGSGNVLLSSAEGFHFQAPFRGTVLFRLSFYCRNACLFKRELPRDFFGAMVKMTGSAKSH